jgi:hypothetical protein
MCCRIGGLILELLKLYILNLPKKYEKITKIQKNSKIFKIFMLKNTIKMKKVTKMLVKTIQINVFFSS